MKYFLAFLILSSVITIARAQQTVPAPRGSQTTIPSASEFRAQVQQELANYNHGAMLYRRCDVFARMINQRVAARLGIGAAREGMMAESSDTAVENDISKSVKDQNETTIAVSRKNSNLIVAAANDDDMTTLSMPAYVSTNSGNTWNTYRLPQPGDGITSAGDPILTADEMGNFYYAFLIESNESDLMVAQSSDGINWTMGSPVLGLNGPSGAFEDKEMIAVDRDPTSPNHGRIYIAWNQFTGDAAGDVFHFLAYSDDEAQTWSFPVEYTQTFGYFPLIRIGEKGTLFIASSTEDDTDIASDNSHGMTVSTDGGLTFSENTISNYTLFPPNANGYPGLKGKNGFRAFPYVAFDVDPSTNQIDAVYGSYDNMDADAALFAVHSSIEGHSWTKPQQIGTPALIGNDHFMPWVSHDAASGTTYISLYSSEEDPALNIGSREVLCTFTSTNQMLNLSTRLFDPLLDTIHGWNFIGDYAGNDVYAGCFASVWTENRPPNHADGEIFAYVSSSPLTSRPFNDNSGVTRQINAEEFDVSNPSPNPVSGNSISLTIASNIQSPAVIRVYDLRGVEVLTSHSMMNPGEQNLVTLDIHALPAGVFHAQISCGDQMAQRDFIVLR